MAFIDASGVKLVEELKRPLRKTNQRSQDLLQQSLGRIGGRESASAMASGRVPGQYVGSALGEAGDTASAGIEDQLLSALAGTSYDEFKNLKEHEASMDLANEIGELSAPGLLEQILSGLSGGARAGAQFHQLYGAMNKPNSNRSTARYPTANDFYNA